MRHVIDVDYNQRTRGGNLIPAKIPIIMGAKIGDTVVCYEPLDESELDGVIQFVNPENNIPGWHIVHILPDWHSIRDIHVCPTRCDEDCEETYCHEGHAVPWKREPGHPYPRIVNGVIEGGYP